MELIAVGVCMVRSIHNENDLQKDEVIFTSRRYLIRRFNNSHQKKPSNCARNAKEISFYRQRILSTIIEGRNQDVQQWYYFPTCFPNTQ